MFRNICYTVILGFLATQFNAQGLADFDALLTSQLQVQDSLELQILSVKKELAKKDKGLQLHSSAGRNEFGDLDNGNIFRLKAGLEWNLLSNGFKANQLESENLELEHELKKIEMRAEAHDDQLGFLEDLIQYSFNAEQLKLLNERAYLLKILINRKESLYHSHSIPYQEVLELYEEYDEINLSSLSLDQYNRFFEELYGNQSSLLNASFLPILEINAEQILDSLDDSFIRDQIIELKNAQFQLKQKQNDNKNLSLYSNFFLRPFESPSSTRYLYSSVGIRFSSSLHSEKNERKRIHELEKEVIKANWKKEDFKTRKKLVEKLLVYDTELRKYIRGIYLLQMIQEEKRLDQAVRFVDYSNPSSDLELLELDLKRLKKEFELLETKEKLYQTLVQICLIGNLETILPFIKEKSFRKVAKKLTGNRILNFSGVQMKPSEHEFFIQYLVKNEFETIIVDTLLDARFLNLIKKNKIRIIGKEDLLYIGAFMNVPTHQFENRMDLENWIDDHYRNGTMENFIINDLQTMLSIDSNTFE